MDFASVIQAIGTVGFPIISFFVAIYALKYSFDASRQDQQKNMETIAELSKAINNNTVVLTQLVERVDDN